MHSCSNDGAIQLGPLSSDAMFEVVEISDACFVHLLLQDVPHAEVFQLVWRWVVVTSSTALNSDIWTVLSWYSGLIFLQLSVMTFCVSLYDDHLIHKVKQWHWLGVADFCCVNLVSHYLNDIPCKNYNYSFVFVKVILKTLLVPFFSGHGVEAAYSYACLDVTWSVCLCVCYSCKLCKNGWTNQYADSCGSREPCIIDVIISKGMINFEGHVLCQS